MRIANRAGRLVLVDGQEFVDVAEVSDGAFSSAPQEIYDRWSQFRAYVREEDPFAAGTGVHLLHAKELGAVAPAPRQVFAIGLNYRDHALEAGFDLPAAPVVFTKYMSSISGPTGQIALSSSEVDWEVELVAVIGQGGRDIPADQGWEHVAGVTIGQDISDRRMQFSAPPAQFGLAKSLAGYSPMGPVLVTPDEFDDPDAIPLGCLVNGRTMQESSTAQMIFPVPTLVAELSSVVELLPGDVIFTGTPAGVGMGQHPPTYLNAGDQLVTWVEGIGEMTHTFE